MKKRTKITLRTKIYLTLMGGLLALAGVIYAANPAPFSSGAPVFPGFPSAFFPTGVAASPDLLLVTPFCTEQAISLACDGSASVYATFPGFGSCREKYMAVAPGQSAGAGFTPRDVFATEGALVFKVSSGVTTLFAALPGCIASDHNGITFDHVGTFGFDMIVTCNEGNVFRVHGDGTVTHIATLFPPDPTLHAIEGPAVVPALFGPHGGEIWVADENANAVHTIGPPPTYTVTLNVLSHFNPEGLYVIPTPTCAYCGNAFYLSEQQQNRLVWAYPLTDFAGLGGKVMITSEAGAAGAETDVISFDGLNYVQTAFPPRVEGVNEGSSMVDCDIPTPTPTTTPTATFTPTATATATFTPTPTATATFTPTPTPTVTPTPTATACTGLFVIGDLDASVGNHVTFWSSQWEKDNHLSGGKAPASFKGFVDCAIPICGGTWTSLPGNSSHPPDTIPADITVIVSSSITKSGPAETGDIVKVVTVHVDPCVPPPHNCYGVPAAPGHQGTGTVTSVICQSTRPHQPTRPARPPR